jgi:hypothetical protein
MTHKQPHPSSLTYVGMLRLPDRPDSLQAWRVLSQTANTFQVQRPDGHRISPLPSTLSGQPVLLTNPHRSGHEGSFMQ